MSKPKINVLIVGQGYAGSLLAWSLINEGVNVTVVDSCPEFSSSRVAAGIIIPVTGRRLAKTYKADSLIPFAKNTYSQIESATNNKLFIEKQALQVFTSVSNRNEWYTRSAELDMEGYCDKILSRETLSPFIVNEFGGILLNYCGYVDSLKLIDSIKTLVGSKGKFINAQFDASDLNLSKNEIQWKGISFSHVIFCEGYHATKNPLFSYIPFKPAKGEILDFTAPGLPDDNIISSGVYILPLGDGKFRTGATYVWDDLTEDTTVSGFEFLKENLSKSISCDFEIIDHKAGIRPAIRDRRPVIGFHPVHRNVGIFNGLGTKGALLAPLFAKQLADQIIYDKLIDQDVSIRRFDGLHPMPAIAE